MHLVDEEIHFIQQSRAEGKNGTQHVEEPYQ